jgi:hypothetical protein
VVTIRLVLGAVFTAMAAGQALSWPHMPEILAAYQVPGVANHGFAAALIAAQLVCGLWLLARSRSTNLAPVGLYLSVALLWTGLGLQGLLRGLEVANCGCFGLYLTQRLSWFVLAQDGLLLLYGYLTVRSARRARGVAAEPSPARSPPPEAV